MNQSEKKEKKNLYSKNIKVCKKKEKGKRKQEHNFVE
tara:strand:+ start:150 stop:260 length:111 start_codon:yes stop_codon:yes gene_type:complete